MAAKPKPANEVLALRVAKRWTQGHLAAKVGVHESTLSRWERRRSGIADERKDQLAQALGVSKAQLMGWEPIDWEAIGSREAIDERIAA